MFDLASFRLLVVGTVLAAALAGCADGADGSDASGTEAPVDASAVNDALAEVAAARSAAAAQVDAELRAGLRVSPLATGLRSPSSVDATLEEVPTVVELFARVAPGQGDLLLDRLDETLVTADDALSTTAAQVAPDSWQAGYLAAQADVVAALRTWSAASREVHELAADGWELWQGVVDAAAVLAEDRYRFRSPEEAAATWEIEVGDQLPEVEALDGALTAAAAARDEAASAVTEADAAAAAVFEQRPSPSDAP